jgi:RNA polymerase sigma-70 factor (sigma-E family)
LDEDSFREFVAVRLKRLSRVAFLLTGDHHAAEDLLQVALIRLAAKWSQLRRDGNPDAYLRKILHHEHISIWRRSRHLRDEKTFAEVPDQPLADGAEDVVRRMMVRQALARLTPRQRSVIVLRFFEDLSEADTAEALGCSPGTVKSQTSHALQRLRQLAPELAQLIENPREALV